jgi:hypothetical protein
MKLIRGKMMTQNAMLKSKAIARHTTANHFLEPEVELVPLELLQVS